MHKDRKIIGLCGAYLFNQQPIQLMKQLRRQGIQYGYCLTAFSCSTDTYEDTPDTKADLELIRLMNYIPLSGMIVLTETIKNPTLLKEILHICHEKHLPVFSIDGCLAGCYNMVFDNISGFEEAVRHVVEYHGCKTINLIAGIENNRISEERILAYRRVLEDNQIPFEPERIGYGDFWERPTRQVVRSFANSTLSMPEAIVCANDAMAIAVCSELGRLGLSVPEDIIVTGFDGIFSGQSHFPVLTTYEPDYADAVSFIIQELNHFSQTAEFQPRNHDIPYLPRINQSCGCKAKTIHNLNHIISTLYDNNNDNGWHNIAMNQLITSNLYNQSILELSKLLPQYIHLWKDYFRFACVKSSMLSSVEVEEHFHEMVSILNLRSGEFEETGTIFPIGDFIPDIDNIRDVDTLIVRPLHSGETIYGYSVEGFQEINEHIMQRCNDFSFFLSYCLNTVLHNARQQKLTQSLRDANKEISMMAYHDSMTKLYNRQGFYKELTKLLQTDHEDERYLYIFSIDMNHLKYINDTFGHAEGDFAITTLANAISAASHPDALCARFGGDEFVVAIISRDEHAYSSEEFFCQIQSQIDAAISTMELLYPIQASVGMCSMPITSSLNPENLIASADENMYRMKQQLEQSDSLSS